MNQQATLNEYPYFSDIENAFVQARGSNLFISSKDWNLIDTWQKKGIPQHIAIAGIQDVFRDRQGKGKVSSLAFCASAVEQRFAEWAAGQVGSSEEVYETTATTDTIEPCAVCGKEICWTLHRD